MTHARINPAHRNPPAEVTPQEAERNKRIMGQNEAPQKQGATTDEQRGTSRSVKTSDPGKTSA